MKEKMMRFMQGRYGVDSFNRFLMWVMIASAALSVVTRIGLFYWVSIVVLIYAYYRMLSRDYAKRSAENQKYMQVTYRLRTSVNQAKKRLKDRKTHRIFKCPQCRQKIRVPKGHGKIAIRCPKCATEFIKKV